MIKKRSSGFTLVELVVSLGVIAVLLVMAFFVVNPQEQLRKYWNGQRKQDLEQIRTALDVYYNDHGCYPTGVPFGDGWTEEEAVLMSKVPEDPRLQCTSTGCYPYQYIVEPETSCPQWAVLYAKLEGTIKQLAVPGARNQCEYIGEKGTGTKEYYLCDTCPVYQLCGSISIGGYNFCYLLGDLKEEDCAALMDVGRVPLTPVPTVGPTEPQATPDPQDQYFACTSDPVRCNSLDDVQELQCKEFGGTMDCYLNDSCCAGMCPGSCGE